MSGTAKTKPTSGRTIPRQPNDLSIQSLEAMNAVTAGVEHQYDSTAAIERNQRCKVSRLFLEPLADNALAWALCATTISTYSTQFPPLLPPKS